MTVTFHARSAGLSAAALLVLGLALPVAAQTTPSPTPAEAEAGAAAAPAQTGAADAASAGTAPASGEAGQDSTHAAPAPAAASGMPDLKPVTFEDGRWYNAEGLPTFKVEEDGTVDYATFSGYRRYHSECHTCHGPDGEGSTYAPALKNSVMGKLDYYDFMQIAASGKQDVGSGQNLVMPAFGTNRNAWCYIDDIYTYLLARGADAIPRGRPAKKADKTEEFAAIEDSCMDG